MNKIKIGISSCLLGNKVRYDGSHKLDNFITETLGHYFDFVPVCPEVECGLPTPREAMRLVGSTENPRLVTQKTKIDLTDKMLDWAQKKLEDLEKENLCAYICKSKSPSSGMERVKVYNDKGFPSKNGVGIFAREFMKKFPLVPVEEEGRLHDLKLRENFIETIFVLQRWREIIVNGKISELITFHKKHKYLLMSHGSKYLNVLGNILAKSTPKTSEKVFREYYNFLIETLKIKPTIKKHSNVLIHMFGYFKNNLSQIEKNEFLEILENFKNSYLPMEQYYLNPHPIELQLRNHV